MTGALWKLQRQHKQLSSFSHLYIEKYDIMWIVYENYIGWRAIAPTIRFRV